MEAFWKNKISVFCLKGE
ncbi:hypothetical protein BAPKO_0066 [Borreliella afzelii PKo]|nr:hypothetical protein BAPKO_0066 [Borreliella afzelii PKo]